MAKKKTRNLNRKHLEFVASRPCMICNARPVQAHHLLKPSDGMRGWGLRAGDEHTVPLCFKHHTELHTKFGNEFKFFEFYLDDMYAGQKMAKALHDGTVYEDDSLPF